MPYKTRSSSAASAKDSIDRKVARSICALPPTSSNARCEIGDLPLYSRITTPTRPVCRASAEDRGVRRRPVRARPNIIAASPAYSRTPSTSARGPTARASGTKPAAIVSASPGSIGGFGANHQLRQAWVFLNMPVMQQPEAYLGRVSDDRFDADVCSRRPLGPSRASRSVRGLGRDHPPFAPSCLPKRFERTGKGPGHAPPDAGGLSRCTRSADVTNKPSEEKRLIRGHLALALAARSRRQSWCSS